MLDPGRTRWHAGHNRCPLGRIAVQFACRVTEGANCSALQIGSTPSASRLSSIKAIICEMGGRAPVARQRFASKPREGAGQNKRSPVGLNQWRLHWLTLTQDLISLAQFAHFSLQLFDPCNLSAGRARSLATITLDLTHPNAKAVRRTTQFTSDRCQRRSLRLIIIAVLHNQPNRTLAELTFSCICNALSGNG